VIFALPGVAMRDLFEALYSEHHIACAAMGEGIRFSPHIYNTMDEIDRVVEAIAQLV
jgi:selenocysteine lyase/cysteine desulfurase